MKRIVIIFSALTIIILLSIYNFNRYDSHYFEQKKQSPTRTLTGLGIYEIHPDYFYAYNHFDTVYVFNYQNCLNPEENIKIKDLVSVKGINIGRDSISATFIHIHRGREFKIYLSLIPFFGFLYLFFRYFKFNPKKFIFHRKNA